MDLKTFLTAIISGSFAIGPALYALLAYTGWLGNLDPKVRRVGVAVAAGILSISAFWLAAWLGYVPAPMLRAEYAEVIWTQGITSGLAAFVSSTVIHGYLQVPKE